MHLRIHCIAYTVFFFKTTTSANQVVTPMPVVIFKKTKKQHTLAEREREERERERLRERERDSTDRQNWCLLDCAQYFEKVCAHSVSIPTGIRRFPIVGERTLTQNWYKLGYGSTPRPDAARALAHNLQNLENYTIDFRDRPLKTKLVQ